MLPTPAPNHTRTTYRQLFASRGFGALIGVAGANVLGASLQILAVSVLVYSRTGSALWASSAFAAGFLPQLLGGALLTSLADRWPARRLLAVAALVRASSAMLIALARLDPSASIAVIGVVAVFSPVPSAAQAALVVRLLPADRYVLGRSVFTVASSGAQLAGLAAGGTVVGLLGARPTLAGAALVQLAGLLAVAALPRTQPTVPGGPQRGRRYVGATWRGNAELLALPVVRQLLLSWWIPVLLLVGAESLIVAYVAEANSPAWETGALLAAFPAGAGLGNLAVGRWFGEESRRRLAPWLLLLLGLGLLPLGLNPPVAVSLAGLVIASGATAYELGGQGLFIEAVPAPRQGLAFGLLNTGMMTGQGLGPLLAGTIAQFVGAGLTISGLGALIIVSTAWLGRLPKPAD